MKEYIFTNHLAHIFKKVLGSLCFFLILGSFIGAQYVSGAGGTYNFADDSGLSVTGDKAGYVETTATPEYIITQVIQIILGILGVIFLIFMIYAGITWMTAAGNEQQITKAQNILTEAIIGLVIVLAAYTITYFISEYFAAKTLTS